MGNGRKSGLRKTLTHGTRNSSDYGGHIKQDTDGSYTSDSKASYSHGYADDGGASDRWMMDNTNAQDVYNSMSYSDKELLRKWIRGDLMGSPGTSYHDLYDTDRQIVDVVDKMSSKFVPGEDFAVRSLSGWALITGNSHQAPQDINAIVGNQYITELPASSAFASEGLTIGHSGKPVEYVFKIPKNAKSVGVWIGNSQVNSSFGDEQREFIINRQTMWSVSGVKFNNKRNIYEVTMKYIGSVKH